MSAGGGSSTRAPDPLAALRDAIVPALAEPPCFVSFSGGRDSSGVLAAAVDAARREGLEPPVPITARFPDAPRSHEAAWQQRVIDHLRLDEWVRVDVAADELDIVGAPAARLLERHGLIAPANMVFVSVTLEAASGGRLLTGMGGDDVFVEWRWRELADALAGRRRLNRFDVLDAGYQFLPRRIRAILDRRHLTPDPPPWLREEVEPEARALLAAERLDEPLAWPRWLEWCAGRVHLRAVTAAFETLGAEAGTKPSHPLLDPGFLAALGELGGPRGLGDRTRTMLAVFGDVLPEDVCARSGKAQFSEVYWGEPARSFLADWDGTGVNLDLVDPDRLRTALSGPDPDPRGWLLLQQAWLHANGHAAATPAADPNPVANL